MGLSPDRQVLHQAQCEARCREARERLRGVGRRRLTLPHGLGDCRHNELRMPCNQGKSFGALRLAYALARIPRLFCSFLLFPLLVGLGLALFQLVLTSLYLTVLGRSSDALEGELSHRREQGKGVLLRLGVTEPFTSTTLCRWQAERPPPGCDLRPFDVAVQVSGATEGEVAAVVALFDGLTPRIHLCEACRAEVTVHAGANARTEVYDVWSLPLLTMVASDSPELRSRVVEVVRAAEGVRDLLGETELVLRGFIAPVSISRLKAIFALIFSVASSLVIGLALALRAHRRILDYFARNDVLLPLVAACGKRTFYGALWWLTLFRVGAYFVAVVPASVLVFIELVSPETQAAFVGGELLSLGLWLGALLSGMSLLVVVASIGELRHRRTFTSLLYRFGPLLVCGLGGLLWGLTLLVPSEFMLNARQVLAGTPILGLVPVLIAPAFRPPHGTLVFHALAASVLILGVLRLNTRWFAAHLEEV